jgi:hypothetical protein
MCQYCKDLLTIIWGSEVVNDGRISCGGSVAGSAVDRMYIYPRALEIAIWDDLRWLDYDDKKTERVRDETTRWVARLNEADGLKLCDTYTPRPVHLEETEEEDI